MKHFKVFRLFVALMLIVSSLPVWGQSFSGSGSGTDSDPYLIYNPNHLNDVHNFIGQSGVVFKLMQNIDLSSWLADNNPTNGWLPIGTQAQPFKGKFLGNNKTITGLFINRSSTNDVGFFGYVDGATISNLTINGTTVKGADHTGGLCGMANNSTISSCNVSISVSSTTSNIGGVLGNSHGCTVNNSSYTGSVSGPSSVAGLSGYAVGANFTNITINATITCTINYSGQCVGYVAGGNTTTTIENIQAVGNQNGANYAGGLVGRARANCVLTINNCTVNGNITGTSYLGGVIGNNEADELTITNCKSTGSITGTSYLGGIVGYNVSQMSASKTYHDGKIQATGQYVGGFIGNNEASGYSVDGCGHIGDVSGSSHVSGGIGRSFNNATSTIYSTNANYQATNTQMSSVSDCFSVGDVTASGDYGGGLVGYSNLCSTESVYLALKLSNYQLFSSYTTSTNMSNLSNGYAQTLYIYTINGSTYYSLNSYSSSNFPGCTFEQTHKYSYTECYKPENRVTKTINTTQKLGENLWYSDMSNSYFSGNIKGANYVGGIIGFGDMINVGTSYASGSIYANQHVGGVAGRLLSSANGNTSYSSITSCVSANEIIVGTNGNAGRIYGSIGDNVTIGANGTTSANKGLATAKVTSAGSTVALDDGPQHGTNVGASTLRLKSNYVGMGWNFDDYWKIQETECYPYKAAQCAPPKITSQLISGATSVSGQSIDGGTVLLLIGDNSYSGAVTNNQWTINVPAGLQSGATVKACATKTGLMQSYFTTGIVGFAGGGTEEDPYLIYTASDLANINSYSYYKIMNDINVSSWITSNSPTTGWIPIGMNSGVSMKQLDGNGKTISGFWTNSTTNYYGLVSTTNEAVIKDLTINLSKNSKVGAYSAILVGKADNSTFTNININGNINGGDRLGGIVGSGSGNSFENCNVTSKITSSGVTGGISGYSMSGNYSNCSYSGTLTGVNFVGGISGGNNSTNSFTSCQVSGSISGSRFVGGITPVCSKTINKCKEDATVVGTSSVGGIVGDNYACITETYSNGTVTATATENNNCYAGGVAGQNLGIIRNSYSTVEVTSAEYGAGIAGVNFGTIDKCYASGNIYAEKWGAGITGYNDDSDAAVTNCFAANNKIQVSEAGGIGMRMIGGFRNGASEPDDTNYALNSMVVSVNNVTKIVYDDPLEGISVNQGQLYAQETYLNNGWDFTDTWGIDEGQGYPYLLAFYEPILVTGISLDKTSMTMQEGSSETLVATVTPAEADNKSLNWTSSDTTVATVDNNGNVSALSAGTATITASTTDGSNISAACTVTVVALQTYMPGDVNGDNVINVTDYVTTASYILEQDPQPFIFEAADLDGNGSVTVGDLVGVADLALNFEGAPRQFAPAAFENGHVAMNASVTSAGNDRYEVALTLDNDVDLTAMQLDLRLPAGMTMTGATLSDRASRSHELNYTDRGDGSYRLLAASSALKTFSGSEGTVLTLTLEGRANGIATMSGIELATPRAESYRLDDLTLDFMTTGLELVDGQSRIYRDGDNIVIVSSVAGKAQLVLPNGKYTTVKVAPGRNVFSTPADGIVIVKTNNNVVKLKF